MTQDEVFHRVEIGGGDFRVAGQRGVGSCRAIKGDIGAHTVDAGIGAPAGDFHGCRL